MKQDSSLIPEEKFIELAGCRVKYLRAGSGPPLVLVHGLAGYSFCFRHNISALASAHTVLALDLPGCGSSTSSAKSKFTLQPLAEFLLEFMRALDLKDPALLGISHGGAVALLAASLARKQKLNVGSLALVAPVNPWSHWGERRAALLGHTWSRLIVPWLAPALVPLHKLFLRRMYGDPRRITPETLAGYSNGLRRPARMKALLARLSAWTHDLQLVRDALPSCTDLPVLLIWGEHDGAVDPASAHPLMRALPKARLAVICGAGHLPFEEKPEEFNRIVSSFLCQF